MIGKKHENRHVIMLVLPKKMVLCKTILVCKMFISIAEPLENIMMIPLVCSHATPRHSMLPAWLDRAMDPLHATQRASIVVLAQQNHDPKNQRLSCVDGSDSALKRRLGVVAPL